MMRHAAAAAAPGPADRPAALRRTLRRPGFAVAHPVFEGAAPTVYGRPRP